MGGKEWGEKNGGKRMGEKNGGKRMGGKEWGDSGPVLLLLSRGHGTAGP